MTIAQIAAIVSLLLAFNVPQPTVDNVQSILENANAKSAIGAPAGVTIEQMATTRIEQILERLDQLQEAISTLEQQRKEELKGAKNATQRNTIFGNYSKQIAPLAEEVKALQKESEDFHSSN